MAVIPIVTYPSPILRKKCQPVVTLDVDPPLRAMEDMEDTLEESDRGAALAANQIGLDLRMFVTNQSITARDRDPIVKDIPPFVINPKIIARSSETEMLDEGCLSFPDFGMKVRRHRHVMVEYCTFLKIEGGWKVQQISQLYSGFWAQVFQHEIDHLDGKLFVDSLPEKKRIEIANYVRRKK